MAQDASFVIAIITDSAFINRWNHIKSYIKEPFNKTFHDFSQQKNELNADFQTNDFVRPYAKLAWKKTKDMDVLIKTEIPLNKTRFMCNSYNP